MFCGVSPKVQSSLVRERVQRTPLSPFSLSHSVIFAEPSSAIFLKPEHQYLNRCLRVPMVKGNRSLNLSNVAATVLYEALRQTGFEGLT